MPTRVCLECGQLTSRPSRRGLCPECMAEWEQQRPSRAVYDNPRWRALSRRAIDRWVLEHGWTCPGWQRPAHPSHDLTGDHATALAASGEAFDPANVGILCRACNGRKAADPATR